MTLGEKIQFYRKKLGMSQEELGQKLLVSRQTISLWENGQTAPTTDNLIRLKEIFGVSVDEILGICKDNEAPAQMPNEAYKLTYTREELAKVYKTISSRTFGKRIKVLILLLICIIIFAKVGHSDYPFMLGIDFGIILLGITLYAKNIFSYKKSWQKSIGKISDSTYEYKFFDDSLWLNIYRGGEKVRESKHYYSDIEQMYDFGEHILLIIAGRSFVLRKSELHENSCVYSLGYKKIKTLNKHSAVSATLFWAAILSLAIGIFIYLNLSGEYFFEKSWIMFCFTPIPLASAVWGLVMKAKGHKCQKNIVAGIIITLMMCAYGSMGFVFSGFHDHSDKPVLRVEQTIGIDIPEYTKINTVDWVDSAQTTLRGYIYYESTVSFDRKSAKRFERTFDGRWLKALPNNLIGISSPQTDYINYDCILVYNTDSREFNALPQNDGTYRFINLLYNRAAAEMKIIEYDMEYQQ